MRVALYARISTNDGRQHLENQLRELWDFINHNQKGQDWAVTKVYTDEISGASDRRPGLDKLIEEAGGYFDLVLVWDLSRLTRGGPAKAFEYISRLKKRGVEFWSLKEPHFRTSGPDGVGEVFIALAAHIAREERRVMQQRIVAGMERARKAGKTFGRPSKRLDPGRLLRYIEEGRSVREIARLEKATPATVQRRLTKLKGTNPSHETTK